MKTSNLSKDDIESIIGEPVVDFSTGSGSNKGDNVAGNLISVKATTCSGKTLDFLYKGFPSGNPQQLQYVVQFGIFRTETCMYEKVFPRIEKLLNERKILKRHENHLPVVNYISGFNDDKNDYVCMEDMRPHGFIMQNKFQCLTIPEVTLVMKELARFHAYTYFLMRYDGERMFEEDDRLYRLKYNCITVEDPMMTEMGSRMFHGYMENTADLLESSNQALASCVRKFLEKHDRKSIHSITRFNHSRTDENCFACIVHGDLWTNNILFKYSQKEDRETPVELKFIDFQLSRRGNIFEDLGYFFWTSTTPSFRKLHLESMLCLYHTSFVKTLTEIDFPKPQNFSRGFLIDEFYRGVLTAYVYMPFALSLQMGNLDFMEEHPDIIGTSDDLPPSSDPVDSKLTTNGKNVEIEYNSCDGQATDPASAFDLNKMIAVDKKLMKLRMENSEKAMERLEELTREIAEMNLL